jgi:hypothetical protein
VPGLYTVIANFVAQTELSPWQKAPMSLSLNQPLHQPLSRHQRVTTTDLMSLPGKGVVAIIIAISIVGINP